MYRYIIFILIFLLLSCNSEKKSTVVPQKQETAQEVGIVEVKKEKISLSSELFGRVKPMQIAEIRPQVSGIILERYFKEGSFIEKGKPLFQIDPALYEVALKVAEGRLAEARANHFSTHTLLRRYEKLVKSNAVSKQEVDNARAAYLQAEASIAVAKADVKKAKINLEYTNVISPIAGYIGRTVITKGALVTANQTQVLATIQSLDPVYVDISLPASEAIRLRHEINAGARKQNQKEISVTLKIEEINKIYPHKGKLEAQELTVDESTGSVALRAIVPNPDLQLIPGMFVNAYVDQLGHEERLLIPQRAIQRDNNGDAHVWIVKKNETVERRRIEAGAMYKDSWIIQEGLDPGEVIVVDNLGELSSGMKVSPMDIEKQAQAEESEE